MRIKLRTIAMMVWTCCFPLTAYVLSNALWAYVGRSLAPLRLDAGTYDTMCVFAAMALGGCSIVVTVAYVADDANAEPK